MPVKSHIKNELLNKLYNLNVLSDNFSHVYTNDDFFSNYIGIHFVFKSNLDLITSF